MTALEREKLVALLPYIGKFKGIAMLTAEPMEGLSEQVRLPDFGAAGSLAWGSLTGAALPGSQAGKP